MMAMHVELLSSRALTRGTTLSKVLTRHSSRSLFFFERIVLALYACQYSGNGIKGGEYRNGIHNGDETEVKIERCASIKTEF